MNQGASLPYAGRGDAARLADSFLNEGEFLCVAFRNDGFIVYITAGVRQLLGFEPEDIVGTNILDLIHPDDLERAILQMSSAIGGQLISGVTRFQVKHKDGSYGPLECFGGAVSDGVDELIGVYCRNPMHQVVVEDVLETLLRGASRDEVLRAVCDVIQWREHGSQFAVCIPGAEGREIVSTGLPDCLAGAYTGEDGPWSARRGEDVDSIEGTAADLPLALQERAAELGLEMFWVQRVKWSKSLPPALLTVWTKGGRITPSVHSYGMSVAANMVELILGWTQQVDEMNRAARIDALTGLANRRAFFAELGQAGRGGALLYCDLDNFKPVNDTLGHAAGDALLALVARRIESAVRHGDIVARLGGDEFAVLCGGATPLEAEEVAERIRAALAEPFALGEERASLSVSIGVAADPVNLDEALLGLADRALYQAKYGGGGTVKAAVRPE
jgi:diguanylate cyclase (GGDEF)-like protein/PAS domain S-box-containing protein